MTTPTIAHAFYVPQFQIKLRGQDIGREVIADVIEVSYNDDEANLDSFEFSLGDWDPVERRPKYSSPWDESGRPYRIGGFDAPNFEPGADIELHLSYVGEGDPVLMLRGEVVSITPSFPASGAPTCRVRCLNYLHRLQRARVTGTFTGTKRDILRQVATDAGVGRVEIAPGADAGAEATDTINNAVAYEELLSRAKDLGLVMWLEDADEGPVLHFEAHGDDAPVATLGWGVDLVSFAPQLSTRSAVEKVVVRGTDPTQAGDAQAVTGEATWADLGITDGALGPRGATGVEQAVYGVVETIDDAEVRSEQEAREKARGRLEQIAGELVQANGSAVGMPELRAGRVVEITKLGPRFSGRYRISRTTHTLGASGYTVTFQAKKLVLP